jgi:hypothetical protein
MPACSPTPFPEQLDKVTAKNTIQIERMIFSFDVCYVSI